MAAGMAGLGVTSELAEKRATAVENQLNGRFTMVFARPGHAAPGRVAEG